MEWISGLKMLLLLAVFLATSQEVASQRKAAAAVSLTALGCYRDRFDSQRIFSSVFLQVNVRRWWPDINHITQECAKAAVVKGYKIFSIQNFADCRWGPNAERDYAKYGYGWYCYRGVGWYDSGSVYKVPNSAAVNGQWSNWSPWSPCSKTCRGGTRSRTRSCTNPPPSNGGAQCSGHRSQSQLCRRNPCEMIIGEVMTAWSSWTSCSKSCGRGTRSRTRRCVHQSALFRFARPVCVGPLSQAQLCNSHRCQGPGIVHGGWSPWRPWSSCSRSCGSGSQTRTRTCTNPPPRNGGNQCAGPNSQTRNCNSNGCPGVVHGGWSPWRPWSSCSRSCGSGSQTRTRTCTNPPPRNGGNQCAGPNSQTRNCNSNGCPGVVHGGWSPWRPWSSCSRSCGSGSQTRTRTCTNPPPRNGGNQCAGPNSQTRNCNSNGCPGCAEGSTVADRCGQRCRCSGSRLVDCTRIRREFTAMTTADRERYIRAVLAVSTDPRYKPDYDRLITLHRTIFTDGIHQRDHFLPWHRWYVLQYENMLRRIDCRITVPYWDWSLVSQTWWRTGPLDVWFSGNSGFGGNGQQPSPRCVTDGPFRRGTWNVVPSAGNGCLRREFNLTENAPDSGAVAALLRIQPATFDDFEITVRLNLHDPVHCLIGGHMCSFDSAVAPEFALHHSFMDKIWMDWQRQSSAHLNAHFPTVASNMPGTGNLHPRAVLDNSRLPGGVRIEYQGSQGPQFQSLGGPNVNSLSGIPRGRFSVLSEKAIRLFNVSKAEVERAKILGRRLLSLPRRSGDTSEGKSA